MKFDMKNIKKVYSDDKHSVFRHPLGHEIKVAHKGLSKKALAEINTIKMASGGYVEGDDNIAEAKRNGAYKQQKEQVPDNAPSNDNKNAISYEEALKRLTFGNKYADGGEVEEEQQPAPVYGVNSANLKVGGTATPAWQPPAEQMQNPQVEMPPEEVPQQVLPQNASYVDDAVNNYGKAMNSEAAAIGAQGREEADAARAHIEDSKALYEQTKSQFDNILAERKAVVADSMNGKIDPKHWWAEKSTGSKIATGIGLILGGIGSGLTGGPNVVVDLMNKQIDRDIEAQKANMGHKSNMLSALTQQLGDVTTATSMLKILKTDQLASQFALAASKTKDPAAKAKAMEAVQMMKLKMAPLHIQLAKQQAIMSGMQQGKFSPAQAVAGLVPKEHQAKAFEELKNVDEVGKAMGSVEHSMREVAKLQSSSNRIASPIQTKSRIDALNLQIGALGKEMFGRLNEQELKMLEQSHVKFTDDPTTVNVKIKNLQEIMSKHMGSPVLDAYGIKVPKKNLSFTPRGR